MDLDTRHIVEQNANFYRMALVTGLMARGYLTRQVREFQRVVEMAFLSNLKSWSLLWEWLTREMSQIRHVQLMAELTVVEIQVIEDFPVRTAQS